MREAVAWYGIGVGVLMLAWWSLDVRRGALRRPDRTTAEIALHLVAELLTAATLIAGGLLVLVDVTAALAMVGLGMLLYTVVQSPGYFLARREREPVWMFLVLQILTVTAIVTLVVTG